MKMWATLECIMFIDVSMVARNTNLKVIILLATQTCGGKEPSASLEIIQFLSD